MRRKHLNLLTIAFILLGAAYGQLSSEQHSSDPQASIAKLISDFQHAAVSGGPVDQFFGPEARSRDKRKIDSLQAKPFLKFAIADYNLAKDLKLEDANHATLNATINWETRDEQASKSTTLSFEQEGGTWYFSNAGFWAVSVVWVVPLIALGLAYGCGLAFMYWHSSRQQWANPRKKTLWQTLAVVPFSIFFYWSRRPWTTP
jgi:hypothetical protein